MNESVPTINRMATIVEPKEPYLNWARSVDDDGLIDKMSRAGLTSVYLIEEEEPADRALRRHWDWIFEEKLHSWSRNRGEWPKKRTYKIFREWFDVRLVELILDPVDAPIFHDEF